MDAECVTVARSLVSVTLCLIPVVIYTLGCVSLTAVSPAQHQGSNSANEAN